ncbi:DUF2514 domain-containing protein [Pseudomonas cichorii]|nr:DUF2514 domain-containing protein [Pseudomonas cichorii]
MLAIGVAVLAGCLWMVYEHGRSVESAEWQGRWNARDAGDMQARSEAEEKNRTEEQRRQSAANQVANDARKEQAVAIDDAGRADAAGDRLHVAAKDFAGRSSCGPGDTGTAQRGETATRAALVLSDLLSRADKRAGELAAAYDRARIAGMACERAYESLR